MKKTTRQVNQEKWFLRIEDYLSREITQSDFCQQAGLNKGTFSYWLRKHRSDSKQTTQNGFIALQPSVELPLSFGEPQITLRRGEVELLFSALPDLQTLIPLIKALA